jgi:hypothetical protein
MTECTRSATQPQQHPAPASFLDGICDFDDDDDTVTARASELDLFFAAFRTHGCGSPATIFRPFSNHETNSTPGIVTRDKFHISFRQGGVRDP